MRFSILVIVGFLMSGVFVGTFGFIAPSYSADVIGQLPSSITGTWVQQLKEGDKVFCKPGQLIVRNRLLIHRHKKCEGQGNRLRLRVREILYEDPWIGKPSYSLIGEVRGAGLTLTYILKLQGSPASIYVSVTSPFGGGGRDIGYFKKR
jgi:hypothetical protein